MLLTDSFCVVTFQTVVSRFAVALPGLAALAMLAVPVWYTLSTVGAGPTVLADASVGHHAETLRRNDKQF